MKRKIITLEVETDAPVAELRKVAFWEMMDWGVEVRVLQAQANAARNPEPKKGRK